MDPTYFSFTNKTELSFSVKNDTQIYCFTNNQLVIIDMTSFKIVEFVNSPMFEGTRHVFRSFDKKSFFILKGAYIYQYHIETRVIDEIFNDMPSDVSWVHISNDGTMITFNIDDERTENITKIYQDGRFIKNIPRPLSLIFDDSNNMYQLNLYCDDIDEKDEDYIRGARSFVRVYSISKWNPYTDRCIEGEKIKMGDATNKKLHLSDDESQISVSSYNRIFTFETEELTLDYSSSELADFSNDYIVTINFDVNGIFVYDASDNTKISEFEIYPDDEKFNRPRGLPEYKLIGRLLIIVYNNLLFKNQPIRIYDIKKGYMGNFNATEPEEYIKKCYLSSDGRYIFTAYRNYITRFDLTQLSINDQKKAFLAGEDNPGNTIYNFTHNVLFDWHLMGEIFNFIPSLKN